MTLALGLLAVAVVTGIAAPSFLRLTVIPGIRPGLALAGWVSSVVLMFLAALASAVLLAIPRGTGIDGLIGMANSCVNLVRSGGDVVWTDIARLSSAVVLLGVLGWTGVVAIRMFRRHRRWRSEHLTLLRSVCRDERSVLWIEDDTPVAYSIGGRRGAIVATRGIDQLDRRERAAVLAHEQAHLRGRHHLLVLAADVLTAALPWLPLCRQASGTVRVLVELAADATAARRHGPGSVRSALLAVSDQGTPREALAMSREAVDARLAWLMADRTRRSGIPVRADYLVGAALPVVPALATIALVVVLVVLYCLGVAA